MTTPLITYQLEGSIALIGLNRPDKRNAINNDIALGLRAAWDCAGLCAGCTWADFHSA